MLQRNPCTSNKIFLHHICLDPDKKHAENIVSKIWHLRFVFVQIYLKIIANIASSNESQVKTKMYKTR